MTDKTASLTGGCLCGAVRYELTAPPPGASYCHCRMCQKATGGPFAVFADLKADTFRVTQGTLAVHPSSRVAERGFCADCGSPLTFRYLDSQWISVTIGSLDDPDAVPPTEHAGIESQLAWVQVDDGLPRSETTLDPAKL